MWATKGVGLLYLPEIGITTFHELGRTLPLALVWLETGKRFLRVLVDAVLQHVVYESPYVYRLEFLYEQGAVE